MRRIALLALTPLALAACPGEIDNVARFLDAAADVRADVTAPPDRPAPDVPSLDAPSDAPPDHAVDAAVDAASDAPPTDLPALDAPAPDGPAGCTLEVERDIFVARCGMAGCHASTDPVSNLDLASPSPASRLVGRAARCRSLPLVVPGDPEGSFLFQKVTQARPACGRQMPTDGGLSPMEINCVRQWITRVDAGMGGG